MLDALKKKLFSGEKGSEEMKKEDLQVSTLAVDEQMAAQLKQAQETLASQAADLQAMQELMEELSTKLNAATDALAAVEAEKSQMIADARAKKLASRKAKVEAAIGTNDKAVALLSATEAMDDAAFEAIVSALTTSVEVEANSEMFTESGVSASADVSKVDIDPVQKLAAAVAAELEKAAAK